VITDDLSVLFGKPDPGVRFRQGTVQWWDPANGQNIIDVGGASLVNVPILNTGEAIALKDGHVVGMLGYGGSWFLLGRITPANDPNFAGASVAFGGAGASATNFTLSTTQTNKVTTSIAVPSWADEAIVLCTVNCSLTNPRAVIDFANLSATIDGVGGGSAQSGFSPLGDASGNYLQSMSASGQRLITSPGATIALAGQVWANGASWGASANNIVNVDAIAVFRSTV